MPISNKTRSSWSRMAMSGLFWVGLTVLSVILVATLGAMTVPFG